MGYRSLRGIDGAGRAFDKTRRARFDTDKRLILHVRPESQSTAEEPRPEPDEPRPRD